MKRIAHAIMGRQAVCHALLILGLFAFQAINLDSDPSPLVEGYQFNDEGYWNHSARSKVLFGTFVPDEFNQDIIASPLFTLIQWGIFSVAGVSIATVRILPLVSLWLTLLMVYFLVKRCSSANAALLAIAVLGLMHEMLMYSKWSTPIITQGCLLTAVLWFWEYGKAGSRWWMAACGAAFAAGTLTTLLTLHYAPGIALFLAIALFIRKEVTWQKVITFIGVASLLGLAALLVHYGPNYDQLQVFARTVGQANFKNDPRGGSANVRQSLQALPFLEIFCSPGVACLTMLGSMWFVDFLASFKEGIRVVLRRISSLELYCVCWIIGALPSIIATPTIAPRRFVIFLIPLTVLASIFVGRMWNAGVAANSSPPVTGFRRALRIGLWFFLTAVWCECAWKCSEILDTRWLTMAGLSVPPTVTAVACLMLAALAGICSLAKKTKLTIAILLAGFFSVNLVLDGIWYSHATYTVRDTSRELRSITGPKTYFLGHFACELALENEVLPVYPPWGRQRMRMNAWFIEESQRVPFLASDDGRGDLIVRFPPERVTEIRQIRLFPVIFGQEEYAYKGSLYVVNPPAKAPRGPANSPGSQPGRPSGQEAAK